MTSFAVVGLGKMGSIYDRLLGADYVIDALPVMNRAYFKTTEEFISYGHPVDLVIVATHSDSHFSIAKQLLNANYNVLIEKPLCLSSDDARRLEALANKKHLVLFQSTLERYSPLIRFLKQNVDISKIEKIMSFRFGSKPERGYVEDVKFDLGIHDVDLWFHLQLKRVPWHVTFGYGKPRREILIYMKNKKLIRLDMLNKYITFENTTLDFTKSSPNNPLLEMVFDIIFRGNKMNEMWSEEIKILEKTKGNEIYLTSP